jgi:hypothetical protein
MKSSDLVVGEPSGNAKRCTLKSKSRSMRKRGDVRVANLSVSTEEKYCTQSEKLHFKLGSNFESNSI